ncbi:MAG: hypothetical protein IJQ53_04810 [Clostridia bacterium]|nr:hypothetical protein [Clostridia bacterium]
MNVKKALSLIIALFTLLSFAACDFSGEKNNSVPESGISTPASSKAESTVSQDESTGPNVIEKTFTGVNVLLDGTDALEDSGYTLDSVFDRQIDVTVRGAEEDVNSLMLADISAYIDVASVADEGEADFLIYVNVPDKVDFVSASESTVTVKIVKREVEIVPVQDGDAYMQGGIIITGKRGMEPFGGTAAYGAATAKTINNFKKAIGDGVNVYVLAEPLASAFYAPEKYAYAIKNHKDCFEGLRDALEDVKYVDALGALSLHIDEDIYSRTDHHWNALGAYYACKEFAKTAGTPFDDLSTFTVQSESGIVGSLYAFSKAQVLKDNPDTFVWYIPTRNHSVSYYNVNNFSGPIMSDKTLFSNASGYIKFIYGDSYTTDIITDVGNGRRLLVFKDSYGNALAPFLVSMFDEIIIADFREFQVDTRAFIKEHGITDVCFALCAFATVNAGSYVNKLVANMK